MVLLNDPHPANAAHGNSTGSIIAVREHGQYSVASRDVLAQHMMVDMSSAKLTATGTLFPCVNHAMGSMANRLNYATILASRVQTGQAQVG